MSEYRNRMGSVVYTGHTESLSGQRDIGGSVATVTDRVVIASGPSDIFKNRTLKIAVSDDRGETFREVFAVPAREEVSYHTCGMLYDRSKQVLMALFGEIEGFGLFDKENQQPDGESLKSQAARQLGHSRLMMARSVDNGETWKLHQLHDYAEDAKQHTVTGGITGCGVQEGDDLFVPQFLITTNETDDALRWEIPLSRIRNLSREENGQSFEFENRFRALSTNSDHDTRYSDETVYVRKLDGSGYLSFHRSNTGTTMDSGGTPFRREYDLSHHPTSYFTRVVTRGFDRRDYDPGMNGPIIIAFNVLRMADGNLLMASRFYGTEHHKAGNILMTSRDEGNTWDYEDDQIPYSLEPLAFWPWGSGGNPSMTYLSDGSLVHTTSAGGGKLLPNAGSLVARFRGFDIGFERIDSTRGTVTVDASTVTAIDPVYVSDIVVTEAHAVDLQLPPPVSFVRFSQDRRKAFLDYTVAGSRPSLRLKIVLANNGNPHRPVFEPHVQIRESSNRR